MLIIKSSFIKPFGCDGLAFDLIEHLSTVGFPFKLSNRCCIENYTLRGIGRYPTVEGDDNKDWYLVINPVSTLSYYSVCNRTIVYTVWDTSELPLEYSDLLNQSRMVIVPSTETKKVFLRSGVNVPIHVVGLGHEPAMLFKSYTKRSLMASPFVFGASGHVVNPKNDRKALQGVIDSFKNAFPSEDNDQVELQIKITKDSVIPNTYDDNRIVVLKDNWNNDEMYDWYYNLSCYVNISQYESFGMQPLEVLSCGIPLITVNHSGIKDYINTDYCYVINHQEYEVYSGDYKTGQWYSPNLDELVGTMKYIERHNTEAHAKSQYSINYYRDKFTKFSSLDKLKKLLIPFCY